MFLLHFDRDIRFIQVPEIRPLRLTATDGLQRGQASRGVDLGGMGGSARQPMKGGITFQDLLSRLQGELQKSRETGNELTTLNGTMSDIHETLGGNMGRPPVSHDEAMARARFIERAPYPDSAGPFLTIGCSRQPSSRGRWTNVVKPVVRSMTVPIADLLKERGIPFIFATGYGDGLEMPTRFENVTLVKKPYSGATLAQALGPLLDSED